MARGAAPTLTLMVLLKSFERLSYMPRLQDVPFAIIGHIRACLQVPSGTALDVTPRTLYRWSGSSAFTIVTVAHNMALY